MAVIVSPGAQTTPSMPTAQQLVSILSGQLTLSDVGDSPGDARYAVSSVDASNMPLLQGVQPVAGLPWPSSAGVTAFNGRTGAVKVSPTDLPAVTTANYQSGWSGGAITYTSTPTTATINVAAATLLYGSGSSNFNASSVNVTGTAGTTVTFYLYFDDPTYAGGAQTLLASTNPEAPITNAGYVNFGQIAVTFPTSGSGGGGGGPGCVSVDAWVIKRGLWGRQRKVRAGRVKVGDQLLLVNGRWGRVSYSARVQQPCRRIETAAGTLDCSASAPLRLQDGSMVVALEMAVGEWLQAREGLQRVSANFCVGLGWVQHITCENDFFWCRSSGSVWFAHHNMKPPA